ncbi:hypothetical protein TeGR_g13106, partial [Tetraparma gracilis]
EAYLKSAEGGAGYSHLVLQLLSSPQYSSVHQIAAIHFKNLIRAGYGEEDGFIPEGDKAVLKDNLVTILTSCSEDAVRKQLGESISSIAAQDYPVKWSGLLPSLVTHFSSPDPATLNNVLYVLASLLKRYTYTTRTDALLTSLQYTLGALQTPFLSLLSSQTQKLLTAPPADPAALEALVTSLELLCSVYFSLNWLELPEYFEDEIARSMSLFQSLLAHSSPSLAPAGDDADEGPVEKMKARIIETLEVYASKDEEPFQPYLQAFTTSIWEQLTTLPTKKPYDNLTTTCLSFLTSIVSKPAHAAMFGSAEVVTQIVSHIILKNVRLREEDVEAYEDDPADYIVSDFEGSDTGSRRKCAIELLKALNRSFSAVATPIVMERVTGMLAEYAKDKGQWIGKDAALSMVTSISVIRESNLGGVTEV